jgi:hypothetical protein
MLAMRMRIFLAQHRRARTVRSAGPAHRPHQIQCALICRPGGRAQCEGAAHRVPRQERPERHDGLAAVGVCDGRTGRGRPRGRVLGTEVRHRARYQLFTLQRLQALLAALLTALLACSSRVCNPSSCAARAPEG